MRGKVHFISGLVVGVTTAAFTFSGSVTGVLASIGASAVGSLIPDIDLPNSTIGKKVKPISIIINKMFGHRTITHAPIWIIPLLILHKFMPNIAHGLSANTITLLQHTIVGYVAGFVCHLLGDMFTVGGIPLLYPFKRTRFHLTNIESGKHDAILSVIVTAICIIAVLACASTGFFLQ